MAVTINRGSQLEQLRKDSFLTDVLLISEDVSLPCHKLILSLQSPYFRTLFSSSGFMESGQDTITMSHIRPELLETIVTYIYTGHIIITKDAAVDILEAVTCLQIEDQERKLIKEISNTLIASAKTANDFQELFYIWNISVTYDLDDVLETVLLEMEVKLESFLTDPEDLMWLGYLGWEELKQVLQRPQLCIESEAVLLNFVLNWASEKVTNMEDFQNLQELLSCVRVSTLDKKFVRNQLCERFPEFCEALTPLNISSGLQCARSCSNCHYIVQYKLSKTQIRNIEDFIDSGQKSLFTGFNLLNPNRQSSLKCVTNMSSMVGTAAGHYGRPVTSGSVMLRWRHLILVIGGLAEIYKNDATRPDILLYNAQKRCWITSLKQSVKPKSGTKLHDVVQINNYAYLIMSKKQSANTGVSSEGYIEALNLEIACQDYKIDKMTLAKLPEDLDEKDFGTCRVGTKIYCIAEKLNWVFDTETHSWSRNAPPIGLIGAGRPVLTWSPPHLYLVSARLEDSTNVIQMLDTDTGQWRRLPSLGTRMSVLDLVCHNGRLFLIGWQPARNNFVLCIDRDSGETKVVLEGVQGVWSKGVVVKGQYFTDIFNQSLV